MAAAGKITTRLAPFAAVALAVGCNQIIGLDAGKPAPKGTGGAGGSSAHTTSATSSTSSTSSASASVTSTSSTSSATSSVSTSSSMGGAGGTSGAGGTGGGGSICDAGLAECGGSCVDMQTDQHNCGRCQHDCMNGTCASGMCQTWTVATSANVAVQGNLVLYAGNQVAAGGAYVMWIDSTGVIHQAFTSGGGSFNTFPGPSAKVGGLAVIDGTVAFVETGSQNVYAGIESTFSKKTVASLPSGCTALALGLTPDANTAFLSGTCAGSSHPLLSCALSGTTCAMLTAQTNGAAMLQVNAAYAFWASSSGISSYSFASGNTATVATGTVVALAIDATNVYWATNGPFTVYALKQGFTSSDKPVTVTTVEYPIMGLAADGTNVYLGTQDLSGGAALSYAPIDGSQQTPTKLSGSQWTNDINAEGYIVVVGGAIYWADLNFTSSPATSTIMGLATP